MTQTYNTPTGGFPLSHHFEMLNDTQRVVAIKRAIAALADPKKRFLELGVGSGVFLEYASHLYADVAGIEQDSDILKIAQQTMRRSTSSNWSLVGGDAAATNYSDRFDVILCEMLSTWCALEPQVQVMNALRGQGMMDSATPIPRRVINLIELASSPYQHGPVELRTAYHQFPGIAAPTIMSTSEVAYELDFAGDDQLPEVVTGEVILHPLVVGRVNSVRLSSFVELAPGFGFYSTDTLMPLLIVPIDQDIDVFRLRPVSFRFTVKHGAGVQELKFQISN